MITSGRTGVDITLSSHLEAEVVELRLGWLSRFWALITGRVRVRGSKPAPRRGPLVHVGPLEVHYSDEEDEW